MTSGFEVDVVADASWLWWVVSGDEVDAAPGDVVESVITRTAVRALGAGTVGRV